MKRSYAEKLTAARDALSAYNGCVAENARIDVDRFLEELKTKVGAVNEATLKMVTVEDLVNLGVPNAIARLIVQVFRDQDAAEGGAPARRITSANAGYASIEDLVAAYDPKQGTAPAAEELKKRTNGAPCVAFRKDGTVDRNTTTREVSLVANGEPSRDTAIVEGRPIKLYPVGVAPSQTADEHPLKRGESLRKDGTDSVGLNWGILPLEVRQLLRLAVESGELAVSSADDMHNAYERAGVQNAFDTLAKRYPNASARFDELKEVGQLPALKIHRGGTPRVNDPFGGHRRY